MQVRVYYEDTDCGGIVYHSNYLKFCERARSEVLFKNNYFKLANKYGFVVKHVDANFIAPSRLGDVLDITTKIIDIKKCSFILKQDIYLKDMIIFSALIKLAYINVENMRVSKMSDNILRILKVWM